MQFLSPDVLCYEMLVTTWSQDSAARTYANYLTQKVRILLFAMIALNGDTGKHCQM